MPKCCVKSCGLKYGSKKLRISLHKVPKNEKLKEKWLESLGQKNIDFTQKVLYVCSLHFEEQYINRTLDIVRLQENAIPIQHPVVNQDVFSETTVRTAAKEVDVEDTSSETNFEHAQAATSLMANPDYTVQRLKIKCCQQRKTIKILNEKCRRQTKKLASYANIIKELKQRKLINNDGSIIIPQFSGPRVVLKRPLTKSRRLIVVSRIRR